MSEIMQLLHQSFVNIVALCLISGFILAVHGSNLQFSYYPNITGNHDGEFLYSEESNLAGGALQVTMDSRNSLLINQAGRVVHKNTLKLWGHKRTDATSFNTTFVINILPLTNPGGEGLAFILTSNRTVPSNSYGPWLGIVNQETNGSSLNQIVAIEFDTRKSDSGDIDSNHIALDVNSMNSIFQFPLDRSVVNLSGGMDLSVKIMYDGKLGNMTVELSTGNGTVSNQQPILSYSFLLNLTNYLPQEVFAGFSASTSTFTELNCVRSWNFTSTEIGKGPLGLLEWVGIILAAILFLMLVGGLIYYIVCKIKKNRAAVDRNASGFDLSTSKQFRLRELVAATSHFDNTRILGRGGIGCVYKGTLKGVEVAIKKFIMVNPSRGEKEFFSEVTTIGQLNHPNLVKLIGWCNESGELLLVYQYMSNGSLDNILFSKPGDQTSAILSWPERIKILIDVASALIYLHDDSQHPLIFHKDIKASNVMLDAEMNAYLGDFGLARSVQEGSSHHTTKVISGTVCYVAPEYCTTGRASVKTDVYSFGALVAEVCCGEKPTENRASPWTNNVIIRIAQFQRAGNILGAADPRLRGEFDVEMMKVVMNLALSCCQSDETQRPTSSLVLKVLRGEESLPDLSEQSPQSAFPYTPSTSSRSTPAKTLQEHLDEDRPINYAVTEISGR